MLTTKKQGQLALVFVAGASLLLTACGPPGVRALHQGDRMIKSGNYDGAIAALQTATNLLAKSPSNVLATAYNLLGLAYHHGATNAASALNARRCYETALFVNRNLAAADYNLGCLDLEQNNLMAAKNSFTTYTALCRDSPGQMRLGDVCLRLALKTPVSADRDRQANFDLSRKSFLNAGALEASAEAANNVAVIDVIRHARPSREALTNAAARLRSALARDPKYGPALLNLAILYDPAGPYKLADVPATLKTYRDYLALDPAPPYSQEVGLLWTNLDRASRMVIQRAGQPSEIPPPTLAPSSGSFTITPSKPVPPPSPPKTNSPPPPDARQPGASMSALTPGHPVPAVIKPEEVLPVHVDTSTVASAPTNVVITDETAAPGEHVTVRPENVNSNAPPLESTMVRKPSLLTRLFGGKPKTPETTANGGTMGSVTPLPTETTIHYLPPVPNTDPGDRAAADRLVNEGVAAAKEAHWKEAMNFYQQAVKADASDYDACEALGVAAIKAGEFDIALESLHHALALNPDSDNARYDYAWTLEKKRYYSDAAAELEKLLEENPGEVRAHLLVGTLYSQQLGQPDLARGHYKKVLELDPKNAEATKIRIWLQNNPGP